MQSFDKLHQTNDGASTHVQIGTTMAPLGFKMGLQQQPMQGFTNVQAAQMIQAREDHPVKGATIGGQ